MGKTTRCLPTVDGGDGAKKKVEYIDEITKTLTIRAMNRKSKLIADMFRFHWMSTEVFCSQNNFLCMSFTPVRSDISRSDIGNGLSASQFYLIQELINVLLSLSLRKCKEQPTHF